jgi:hypothetical protein
VFREDHLAIDDDIELAAPAGLDGDVVTELLLDVGRETRSLGLVASHFAVFDQDLHRLAPLHLRQG